MFGAPFLPHNFTQLYQQPQNVPQGNRYVVESTTEFYLIFLNDDNYCSDVVVIFSYASFL